MKSIFAEYGVPDTLIMDNGPCYDSKEFKSFTQKYNFEHVTSSPHYHEGNGLAEKYVDIIKNHLQKALIQKRTHISPCLFTKQHHLTASYHHQWNY